MSQKHRVLPLLLLGKSSIHSYMSCGQKPFTHTSYNLSTYAPLSYSLWQKYTLHKYESTSVPSLARLRRLLEAGNSARYLRTSWGRVRNPCQKIARSEDYKSSKIFICKLQYPPEHSWNKVSGNRIRKICSFFWVILKMFWYIEIVF